MLIRTNKLCWFSTGTCAKDIFAAGLLLALALTGCQSGKGAYYVAPRVIGRVLAADTRQPLPDTTVRRVVPIPSAGEATPPKGTQMMMQPGGVQTDDHGRYVLDEVKVAALFRHGSWRSVTVSFAHNGYESFETNYFMADFQTLSPEGVPLVHAGDVLLKPISP